MPTKYRELSAKERREYIAARNASIVSFNLGDAKIKEQLRLAAKSEGRTVNNWISFHVLPVLKDKLSAAIAKGRN